jgi:hypothetical protein
MQTNQPFNSSGLRDNHRHGKVSTFFEEKTKVNSHIAIVTAYFTVAAYMRMKPVLARVKKHDSYLVPPRLLLGLKPLPKTP